MFNVRDNFSQIKREHNGSPLVYLDSAASALKLDKVVDRINTFNSNEASNVHRGAHLVSNEGTENYEAARAEVASFIKADENEIIFTRGTTESINLVAQALTGRFNEGDEIILSVMDHHSNIIPWQVLAQKDKLKLKFIPITDQAELDYQAYESLLSEKTCLVAVTHVSNTLGTENDIERIVKSAKKFNALTLIDAAQSITLSKLDVKNLDCDFLAFSGHKLFAPFGIGVLFGKNELLNELPPYQYGGSMISTVDYESSVFLEAPQRFEAGTPNVSGAIGLAEAIKFFRELDINEVREHEKKLLDLAKENLSGIDGLKIFSSSESCKNILCFEIKGIHAADLGQLLDEQGVAVRVGHHCTQLLLKSLGVTSTVRASISIYNNEEDILAFCNAVIKAKDLLL